MIGETLIPYLNVISRWTLFITVLYKAYNTRDKGWAILTTAFFIDALDIESYFLTPLGITMSPDAYAVAGGLPNFLIAILLVWGAVHLKYGESRLRHVVCVSLIIMTAYVWLFLTAAGVVHGPFAQSSVPSLFFGLSFIYLGVVLLNYVVSSHWVEKMFPWGLILLGTLNLTYPVTRFIDWFAPIGFLLGGLFRFIAAVGAIKFVFYPVSPLSKPVKVEAKSGAFMFHSRREAEAKFGEIFQKPGSIVITRENVREIMKTAHPETLVFWITRAKEGRLSESPTVYAASPTRIDILTDLIAKALGQGYHTVYIDAFEYIMLENGFENAMKFLLNVKDRVLSQNGTMILVVNPNALEPRQRKILEREFKEGVI